MLGAWAWNRPFRWRRHFHCAYRAMHCLPFFAWHYNPRPRWIMRAVAVDWFKSATPDASLIVRGNIAGQINERVLWTLENCIVITGWQSCFCYPISFRRWASCWQFPQISNVSVNRTMNSLELLYLYVWNRIFKKFSLLLSNICIFWMISVYIFIHGNRSQSLVPVNDRKRTKCHTEEKAVR